jgi:hypothetical protein
MKGKPWTIDEEKQLKELIEAKTPIDVIAVKLNRQPDAVLIKCKRLKLKLEVVVAKSYTTTTTTTSLVLPKELLSVEEALKILAGALKASCKSGLDKVEVQRLQVVATLARTYKDILADYMDYRGLEVEMLEWRAKYADLVKKTSNVATK